MLSLKQLKDISEEDSSPFCLSEEECTQEWEEFLKKLKEDEREEVIKYLRLELQSRQKCRSKSLAFIKNLTTKAVWLASSSERVRGEEALEVILITLFEIMESTWSFPEILLDDILGLGLAAVRRCSSRVIANVLLNYCLGRLDVETNLSQRWLDLFGRLFQIISTRGDIPLEGDLVKGKNFREHMVHELCKKRWIQVEEPSNASKLIKGPILVLRELPSIEKLEITYIVEKFEDILQSVALSKDSFIVLLPIVIDIAGNLYPGRLLTIMNKVFSANLSDDKWCQKNVPLRLWDVIGIFCEACRNCQPILREVLARATASAYDSTLVLTPFMFGILLGLTSIDYIRGKIVDSLKGAIAQWFEDVHLCTLYMWYKGVVRQPVDVLKKVRSLLDQCSSVEIDMLSGGLKDLGLKLLESSKSTKISKIASSMCVELGSYFISILVQKDREYLSLIWKDLLKPESLAHIDCLSSCLNVSTRRVGQEEFIGQSSELFRYIPAMTVSSASEIIKSLMNSLQLYPNLLNELMIVVRKHFWKSVEAGRVCVEVLCVILSNSTVLGSSQLMTPCSDDDDLLLLSSQSSQCSRNSSGFDNSPLCHEILDLAKRFLQLDSKVRQQLYLGFHKVARSNPMLNELISAQLGNHCKQYAEKSVQDIFDQLFKIVDRPSVHVEVQDELGFLLQCICFVFLKSEELIKRNPSSLVFLNFKKTINGFLQLITSLSAEKIHDVALNISKNLSNQYLVEDEVKLYVQNVILLQGMQMCEAAFEFLILKDDWSNDEELPNKILNTYKELDKAFNNTVMSASSSSKRLKLSKDTDKTTSKNPSNDACSAESTSSGHAKKPKKINLKCDPKFHIINIDSVCRILSFLYTKTDSTIPVALRKVHNDEDFEIILLHTALEKVTKIKSGLSIHERQRSPTDIKNSLSYLIEIIWKKLDDMADQWEKGLLSSMDECALLMETRLEVIKAILQMFNDEDLVPRVQNFYRYRLFIANNSSLKNPLEMLFDKWKRLLNFMSVKVNGLNGKSASLLYDILFVVSTTMEPDQFTEGVLLWVWKYMTCKRPTSACDNFSEFLVSSVMDVFFTCYDKCQTVQSVCVGKLSELVHSTLGDNDDDAAQRRQCSWFLNESSSSGILLCICRYAHTHIDLLTKVLGRLKADRKYIGCSESTEIIEKCFTRINYLVKIIREIIKSKFPPGPAANKLISVVTYFYTFLCKLAEHYVDLNRHSSYNCPISSFKALVKTIGRDLKPKIECMIQHFESIQREKATSSISYKKGTVSRKALSQDAKLVPNLIYNMEKFEKFVIALSKKVEVDLLSGLKLSTARDFRLEASKFREALEDLDDSMNSNNGAGPSTASAEDNQKKTRKKRKVKP